MTGDPGGHIDRLLCASPCTSRGSGRARHRIAKPIIVKEAALVMVARGLSRDLRRAVALASVVARSSVEGGAVDWGFDHRFVAAMMGN